MKIKVFVILSAILLSFCTLLIFNRENKENKIVNIVFTTDVGYKDYTKVAIKSAIKNKKKNSIYNIYIICVNLTDSQRKEFDFLNDKNVIIKTIPEDIEAVTKFENYDIRHYVTKADLFKFLIPDIFSDLDKILYIDSDTLILKDLTKLYNTDIKNFPLAAVKGIKSNMETEKISEHGIKYKYEYYDYTYNCGVLLYNLDEFRKNNIKEKLVKNKLNDRYRDLRTQRAFNTAIPLSDIKQLSPIYNVYSRWDKKNDDYEWKTPLWLMYKRAVIVHFAGREKPWIIPDVKFGKEWWKYARMINPEWKVETQNVEKYMIDRRP